MTKVRGLGSGMRDENHNGRPHFLKSPSCEDCLRLEDTTNLKETPLCPVVLDWPRAKIFNNRLHQPSLPFFGVKPGSAEIRAGQVG